MDLETRYGHLLERHGNGALGRRGFLGRIAAMAIGCGLVVPGLARFAPARAGQTVRYDGFGGYSQEAFDRLVLKPFTEKTGTAVTPGSDAHPDSILAPIPAQGGHHYNIFLAPQEPTPIP